MKSIKKLAMTIISLFMIACVFTAQVNLVNAEGGTASVATKEEFTNALADDSISYITLSADLNLTGLNTIDVSNRTIDLGGYKITADNFTLIFAGQNFVIKNGSFSADGGSYAMFIGDDGITTNNVVIENTNNDGGINVYNATNVVLRNVSACGTKYYAVWCDEGAQVKIESGYYETNGVTVLGTVEGNVDVSLEITGGTFNNATKELLLAGDNRQHPVITGGYFMNSPASYVPTGYKTEQGVWPVNGKTYAYAVSAVPAAVNKIESVSVNTYTDEAGTALDNTNPVSSKLTDSTITLSGKISASDKLIVVSYTTTDGTTGTANISYDSTSKTFSKPIDFKVGNTTYSFDTTGLSVLSDKVAAVVTEPKAETALPAGSTTKQQQAASDVKDAITNNSTLTDSTGLAAAVSEKVDAAGQGTSSGIESTDDSGKKVKLTADSSATAKAISDAGITGKANDPSNKVVMVAQSYLDIKVADVTMDQSNVVTEITLNIEPKYNVVAVVVGANETVDSNTTIDTTKDSGNAAVVSTAQDMKVTTPVTISVPLPSTIKIDPDNFYVKHVHTNDDGSTSTYYYKAVVTSTVVNSKTVNVATFTTTNGFSAFTFKSDTRKATINFEGADSIGYTLSGVNTKFPVAAKAGYTLTGWKISDGSTTYAESAATLSDELLTALDGKNVDATPVFIKNTYDLSVQDVDFGTLTYGDAQPEAKAITITSSGNTASSISSVTVDSQDFVIAGDGASVGAGKTIASWTVCPAEGINAGTHKATITVTYDNGAAATASVSVKVGTAAQSAPASVEQDSVTSSSITVKKIAANDHGSAVEYRINGGAWQTSNEFTGLSADTEYLIEARYVSSANYEASEVSSVKIKTAAESKASTSADTKDNTGHMGWTLCLSLSAVIAACALYVLKHQTSKQ